MTVRYSSVKGRLVHKMPPYLLKCSSGGLCGVSQPLSFQMVYFDSVSSSPGTDSYWGWSLPAPVPLPFPQKVTRALSSVLEHLGVVTPNIAPIE